MTFDIVIGNPPYQEMTGGGASTPDAIPMYNKFIERSIELNTKYISMIIPSRWMSGGKVILDEFRRRMIENKQLEIVVAYNKTSDIFDGVGITGGVQYFLWNRDYHGDTIVINREIGKDDSIVTRDLSSYTYSNAHSKQQYMVIMDNKSERIVHKIMWAIKDCGSTLIETVLNRTPYGLSSDFSDSAEQTTEKNIKVICSNGRITWTDTNHITQNSDTIGKYKVYTGYKNPDKIGASDSTVYNVLNPPRVLKPMEICSMSYLILDTFNTEEEALNMATYLKLKFSRFLIICTLTSTALTSRNFMFVPVEDYNKQWTDEELYKKYNLTQDEIEYIESRIKEMK